MKASRTFLSHLFSALFCLCAFVQPAMSQAPEPELKMVNGIQLMSGGIGSEESEMLIELGKKWPLTLQFAQDHPQRPLWVADVKVKVYDNTKKLILETLSEGPIFLINLNPGTYAFEFNYDGRPLRQTIRIDGGQHAKLNITWPKK
jgi:hypothetical protein